MNETQQRGERWTCYWCRKELTGKSYVAVRRRGGYLKDGGQVLRFCPECRTKMDRLAADTPGH
jgi:hypothetical protein